MSYTPNNSAIYQAAFCGAQAGIGASGFLIDATSSDYAAITQTAGQWAQAIDTAWGVTPANGSQP